MKARRKAGERERVGESNGRVAVWPFLAHAFGSVNTGGVVQTDSSWCEVESLTACSGTEKLLIYHSVNCFLVVAFSANPCLVTFKGAMETKFKFGSLKRLIFPITVIPTLSQTSNK